MKTCPQCGLRYPQESTFCFVDGATLAAAKDARIGTTVGGRYVLESVVGEGGMATVYRARHKLVDRPCAVKVLAAQLTADGTICERFRREARHAQRIAHPNIIEIFDQGTTDDGAPFLVMELLEGTSLADLVARGALPLDRVLSIGIQMSRALARAHDFEVIHRDLKPENVFVMQGDRVKLLDFGIARCAQDARLTGLGEVFGTPQYMAPERGTSIDAGPPADLYALGVVLYETLSQEVPYDAPNAASILVKHMKAPVPHLRDKVPSVPPALDKLVFQLMAKDPSDRPVDAHAVLRELTAISVAEGFAVPAEPEFEAARASTTAVAREPQSRWHRRIEVFDRMLARGFGGRPPIDLARMLEQLKAHMAEIRSLEAQATAEQQRLEAIEHEGREGRMRLGRAMDALSVDVSKTREEARALRAQCAPLAKKIEALSAESKVRHKELVRWEGRSGFVEPYRELAQAYRDVADTIDRWYEVRAAERAAEAGAVEKEQTVADVDYQIRELRSSLQTFDKSLEERKNVCRSAIAEMGRRAELLEGELMNVASRFCAPLRAKPELGELFLELERG
jgi:serine/threonine-protein kinase